MKIPKLTKSKTGERGVALVEFAIVLPVLLILVFSIWEFGHVFNAWLAVTNAAREGARYAAAGEEDDDVKLKVQDYIYNRFYDRLDTDNWGDITIDWDIADCTNDSCFKLDKTDPKQVKVTVKAKVETWVPWGPVFNNAPYIVIDGQTVMRR